MKRPLKRWLSNTALLVCSVAVVFFALEVYLRFVDPQSLRLSRPDAVLGWTHVPNTSGVWRSSCFENELAFNGEGMRDIAHDLEKPEGTTRIAVIGDSFVTAQEVRFEETMFRQLQAVLRKRGHDVEVLGFGVRGFGTDQEYLLLEHFVLKYDPDVVILAFVPNDVRNNLLALDMNPAKPYFELSSDGSLTQRPFTPMPDHSGSWKATLFQNLHVVRFAYFTASRVPAIRNALVKYGIYANVTPKPSGPDDLLSDTVLRRPPWPPVWEEAWRVTTGLLRQMNTTAKDAGADFLLFSVTKANQIDDDDFEALQDQHPNIALDQDALYRRLAAFAAREDIAFVSSLSAMRDLQAGGTPVHLACDPHWTPHAHRRAAELLADHLVSGGFP